MFHRMIEIIQTDITTLDVDAIVNAANRGLRGGGGVDGAIHRAAGPGLLEELRQYDGRAPGDAVLTAGHRLPARWVVHAVGPVWHGGTAGEPATLRRAYERAFALAQGVGARSIAFPAISTGVYGYPKDDAARIAVDTVRAASTEVEAVQLVAFSTDDLRRYEALLA